MSSGGLARQGRRWALSALGVLAALSVPLLAAEAFIRCFHAHLPRDVRVVWLRFKVVPSMHNPDRQLLWTPKPEFAMEYPGEGAGWSLRHRPYPGFPRIGFRGGPDDFSGPAPDIAVLGDSYTYAFEVDQDQTYVQRLRTISGHSAVNLGVTSYGTSQEALLYKLYGQTFHPRLLLQVIAQNDPLDNIFFNEINAKKDLRMKNMCWFLNFPQDSLSCSLTKWATSHSVVGNIVMFRWHVLMKRQEYSNSALMDRGTEMICRDVAEINSLARSQGIKYAAVLLGHWKSENFSAPRKTLENCLQTGRIPYLQLDDVAESRRTGVAYFGAYDGHWNERGHDYVARQLLQFLRERRWL